MNGYSVYEHVFPNGKRYIGITKANPPETRWANGNGYKKQTKVYKAIQHYGWDSIEHNVIASGLDKDGAERLEQYLIAQLDTIANGYNIAIGGNVGGKATYLSPYLMMMINSACKRWSSSDFADSCAEVCRNDRFDRDAAEFWNEACRAVVGKWREYSSTKYDDIACFWFHIEEYVRLHAWLSIGKDPNEWYELFPSYERFGPDLRDRWQDYLDGKIKVFCEYTDVVDEKTLEPIFGALSIC